MTPRPRAASGPSRLAAALGALALLPLLSAPAEAQWVLGPGEGWTQLTVFRHETGEEFERDGEVRDFENQGHAVTTSYFVTTAVGLADGLDVWAQAPLQQLEFTDVSSDLEKTAIGDTRLWVRAGPRLVSPQLARSLPVTLALQAGVKIPVSDFPVDSEIIPVTDGQRDWEGMLQVGRSFFPALPLYLKGWVGYRLREENEEIRRDFGNELFALAEVGGRAGPLHWRLTMNGLWGEPPVIEGVEVASAERKIVELLPVVGIPTPLGGLRLEVGGRFPVDGKNLPAGPALRSGFFVPWSL